MAVVGIDGRFLRVNRRICDILGFSENELLSKKFQEITYADDLEMDLANVASLLKGEISSFSMEKRYVRSNGFLVWASLTVALVRNDEGQPQYFIAGINEITKRKQAEEALLRSNAELEQFAYVISHDLRQPLRMVSSFSSLLENRIQDRVAGEEMEFLGFIRNGAKRMDEMLVSLLEYSRVGSKGEPMARTEAREALDEAIKFLEPAIAEAKAQIHVSGEWPQIVASNNEMVRLFQNLIGNAVKYRSHDRNSCIEVSVEANGKMWIFAVKDNGIGISPAYTAKLFNMFQRLHSDDKYEGTGIGLAICRKIVERHGGKIWVDGEEDKGCVFRFSLPNQLS
jgi:PAS domain S-box-containing protein